jgi:O-antigen/teichoic acid export membrane protein
VPGTELAARRYLRIDAVYCAGAGVLALALCLPLARLYGVPPESIAGVGLTTVVWSWLLLRLAGRRDWRPALRLVAAANAAASAAVAVLAGVAPAGAPRLLLIAVAVEVAAFAAVQLRLLRHGRDDG